MNTVKISFSDKYLNNYAVINSIEDYFGPVAGYTIAVAGARREGDKLVVSKVCAGIPKLDSIKDQEFTIEVDSEGVERVRLYSTGNGCYWYLYANKVYKI